MKLNWYQKIFNWFTSEFCWCGRAREPQGWYDSMQCPLHDYLTEDEIKEVKKNK